MKTANGFNLQTQNWEKVSSEDFESHFLDENKYAKFKCDGCGAQASLVHTSIKEWHFRSLNHKKNCPVASEEKHRTEKILSDTVINVEKLLSGSDTEHIEREITTVDPGGEGDNDIPTDEIDGEEEVILDRHTKKIGSMSSLATEISRRNLDDRIGKIPIKRIICTEENYRLLSGAAWEGPLVVNLVRCSPTTCFPHGTVIPEGFLVFKHINEDSNVYFLVKCKNPNNNKLFWTNVLGSWITGKKNKPLGSIVTVFGNWKLFDILPTNDVLYLAEVNYCAIKISDNPVLPFSEDD